MTRLINLSPLTFLSSLHFNGKDGLQNVVMASCNYIAKENIAHSLAASSWLALKNVGKVVLVDWESSPPYSLSLPDVILNDPRLKLIRVMNQSTFKITWAINLAAQFVPEGSMVLKVDCDTVVSSDFFIRHPVLPNMGYAGNHRYARNENERHLNGVFLISSNLFKDVGGFDERIQGYGHDDSNLYERLSIHGAELKLIDFDSVHHMHHSNEERIQNVPRESHYPEF